MGIELARAFVTVRGDAGQVAADLKRARPAVEAVMKDMASIVVVVPRADLSKIESDLKKVKPMVESLAKDVKAGITAVLAPISAIGTSQIFKGLQEAGKAEQIKIAFETMIGSAKEAQKTLQDLTQFAAKTPFRMPEVLQAARGLVQFGERGEELMETLRILGNAAAGTSSNFGMVALIFNQVRGVGKLLTQDFRQLSTRGIISLQDIADYFGVARDAAQEMLSEGKVSFEDLRNILKKLSEEGGRFYNMTEKQSTSLPGLLSTLADNLDMTSRVLGEAMLPVTKEIVSWIMMATEGVRSWIGQNKELAASLTVSITLVSTLGAALLGARIAATLFGISLKGALIGTGIGIALVALGTAIGWLIQKFKLFGMAVEEVDVGKEMEKAKETINKIREGLKGTDKNLMPGLKGVKGDLKEIKDVLTDIKDLTPINLPGYEPRQRNEGLEFLERIHKRYNEAVNGILSLKKRLRPYEFMLFATQDPWGNYRINESLYGRWKRWPEVFQNEIRSWGPEVEKIVFRYNRLRDVFASFRNDPKVAADALNEFENRLVNIDERGKLEEIKTQLNALAAAGLYTKDQVEALWKSFYEESPFGKIAKQIEDVRFETKALAEGWDDARVELEKFARQKWVTYDKVQEMSKAIALREKLKIGARIKEEIKSPAEETKKLISDIQELVALREKGIAVGLTRQEAVKRLEMEREKIAGELPQPRPTLEAGRFGFADFERALQDALLRKDDPAKKTAQNTAEMKALLASIDEAIQSLGKKMQQGPGVFGE